MILVAGEALVDLTPAHCGDGTGYLPRPGGSPYNVAIGLGRLDVPVAFLGRLSTDTFGRLLRDIGGPRRRVNRRRADNPLGPAWRR